MKNLTTTTAALVLTMILVGATGCATTQPHVYVLGKHIMSKAEKEHKAPLPPQEKSPLGDDKIVAMSWFW